MELTEPVENRGKIDEYIIFSTIVVFIFDASLGFKKTFALEISSNKDITFVKKGKYK